jgi:peptide chain release factor 1
VSDLLHDMPSAAVARLEALREDRASIERALSDPASMSDHRLVRDLSIRKAAIDPILERWERLRGLESEAAELEAAAAGEDAELAAMAREELPSVRSRAGELVEEIIERLVTADDSGVGSVILEIRAGVGGDEAGLWAADLLSMYEAYAQRRGWAFEVMEAQGSVSGAAGGGVKSATVSVSGEGAWESLLGEAGVHCVKRVPATEAQGRIHTSTATVAALPEPSEVEVEIDPNDVEEHITTAQGPGGQNVNKVATAVHLLHRPSGIEVRMQETKSQRQNREKAWRLLRARLYERQMEEARAAREAARSEQIGAGARSERIRTYRYKDNMAVDHRLGESFGLQKVLSGDLDEVAAGLRRRRIEERLAAL